MKTIVFDFDGTLADSLVVMLGIYNEMAEEKGFRKVTEKDWQELRQGTIAKGLKWTGIKPLQIPGLITHGMRLVEAKKADIKLFDEIIPVVKQLADDGHQLFVLSTNSQPVIQEVLDKHGIGGYMHVLKSSRVFGKAQALRKLMRMNKLDSRKVWMIGDEVRDMQAAKKAGVRAIAVNWGFQPGTTLAAVGEVTLVNTPAEIVKIANREG